MAPALDRWCGVKANRNHLYETVGPPSAELPNERCSRQALFGYGFAAMVVVCLQLVISLPPNERCSRQALFECGFAAMVVACLQLN